MNIILFDAAELSASGDVRVTGTRATHLRHVLNVTPDQTVRVGLIDGPFGEGTVRVVDEDAVELQCTFEAHTPERPRVDLLLALPRPKVMRRLWAQLAAMGVGRIILTNAERVERHYFDTHVLTPETYRPLLIEGLQQARDTRVPEVSIHRRFKVLVEDELDGFCGGTVQRVVADPAAKTSIADLPRAGVAERLLLAVGPEGGWNIFETDLLARHGFVPFNMGARTLRSDTACIALLAMLTMTPAPK